VTKLSKFQNVTHQYLLQKSALIIIEPLYFPVLRLISHLPVCVYYCQHQVPQVTCQTEYVVDLYLDANCLIPMWAASLKKHDLASFSFLADRTSGRAIGTVLRLSVSLSVTLCIVAKRCVLEQKLLLRAYRKSYMRNRLVPKWLTLTSV